MSEIVSEPKIDKPKNCPIIEWKEEGIELTVLNIILNSIGEKAAQLPYMSFTGTRRPLKNEIEIRFGSIVVKVSASKDLFTNSYDPIWDIMLLLRVSKLDRLNGYDGLKIKIIEESVDENGEISEKTILE